MVRFSLAALLLITGVSGVALARDISGSVAYLERIALPPGAELLVVLSGPGGPLVEARSTPEGQVPLPFSIATDDTGALLTPGADEGPGPWVT